MLTFDSGDRVEFILEDIVERSGRRRLGVIRVSNASVGRVWTARTHACMITKSSLVNVRM